MKPPRLKWSGRGNADRVSACGRYRVRLVGHPFGGQREWMALLTAFDQQGQPQWLNKHGEVDQLHAVDDRGSVPWAKQVAQAHADRVWRETMAKPLRERRSS